MKQVAQVFAMLFAGLCLTRAQPTDVGAQLVAAERKIEEIRSRVSPRIGDTEVDVRTRFGEPRGKTSRADDARYDVDGVGVYRWFYRTDIREKEEATGLWPVFSVEMVVYLIDGRVAGSTLEVASANARRYVSVDGVVESHSGAPPALRHGANGSLVFDYHVAEGRLHTRSQLLHMLEAYDGWLSKVKKPNKALQPTPTAVTSPAAQEPRQP